MSKIRVLVPALVACLAAACSSAPPQQPAPVPPAAVTPAPSIAGTWVLTVDSPVGSRASDAVFAQSGGSLSGKIMSPRGEVPLTGTVKGDAVEFGINVKVQGQDLQIDYAGTVTGDTMSGTVQFGSFGEGTWTGRKKAQWP